MYQPKKRDIGLYLVGLLAVIAGIMVVFGLSGCPSKYKVAWGTTAAVASARNATDEGIGKAFERRLDHCVKDRPEGKCDDKCQTCVKQSNEYAAILAWRTFVRPSVNASLQTTVTAITIAEKVDKEKGSVDWKPLLKDAVCGLIKVLAEFKELFPKEALIAFNYMDIAKGFVCEK